MGHPFRPFLIGIKAGGKPAAAKLLALRRMIYVKAACHLCMQIARMWQPTATAPFDCDIELAVIDADGPHALVFACRRILAGWMNAETRERLDVHPTHWRHWDATLHAVA